MDIITIATSVLLVLAAFALVQTASIYRATQTYARATRWTRTLATPWRYEFEGPNAKAILKAHPIPLFWKGHVICEQCKDDHRYDMIGFAWDIKDTFFAKLDEFPTE